MDLVLGMSGLSGKVGSFRGMMKERGVQTRVDVDVRIDNTIWQIYDRGDYCCCFCRSSKCGVDRSNEVHPAYPSVMPPPSHPSSYSHRPGAYTAAHSHP